MLRRMAFGELETTARRSQASVVPTWDVLGTARPDASGRVPSGL